MEKTGVLVSTRGGRVVVKVGKTSVVDTKNIGVDDTMGMVEGS